MIPDFTPIDPTKVLALNIAYLSWGNIVYYSYEGLYEVWQISERRPSEYASQRISQPKHPSDPTLHKTDFIALGNSLVTYGYIG